MYLVIFTHTDASIAGALPSWSGALVTVNRNLSVIRKREEIGGGRLEIHDSAYDSSEPQADRKAAP
jgi:hypothetical protein